MGRPLTTVRQTLLLCAARSCVPRSPKTNLTISLFKVFAATRHKEGQPCKCSLGESGCPYMNEAHTDAHLTQRGRLQAGAAGVSLLRTRPLPEVGLVSPLSRTLQTATIACAKAAGMGLRLRLQAVEELRERNGVHACDKRSAKEDVMGLYPGVDFSGIASGPDALFSMVRETEKELAERGKQFFLGLKDREEKSFAVFTHSSFLYNTMSRAFLTPDPKGKSRVLFFLQWRLCVVEMIWAWFLH